MSLSSTAATSGPCVLLVDDDPELRHRLDGMLSENGFSVCTAEDGPAALRTFARHTIDLIVLDLGLPGLDGIEVLRAFRAGSEVPILVLSGRDLESDLVLAFEVGADDYVIKPFRSRELLARVRAALRRASAPRNHTLGDLELDRAQRVARQHGQELELSPIEFDLLAALLSAPGQVLARAALLRRAGRTASVSDRTVDVHVSRLRRKLGDDPRRARLIKTIHGVGYMLVAEAEG